MRFFLLFVILLLPLLGCMSSFDSGDYRHRVICATHPAFCYSLTGQGG